MILTTVAPEVVNYSGNYPYGSAAKGTCRGRTTPVGFMRVANAFGLYDTHGNVWEWCMDYWHDTYNDAPTDGSSWETAADTRYRVLRGGSWYNLGNDCRSAARQRLRPGGGVAFSYGQGDLGFRVVAVARTP